MPPAKRKPGRPVTGNPRLTQIAVRLSDDERQQIEVRAASESRSLSSWLRIAALEKLRGV